MRGTGHKKVIPESRVRTAVYAPGALVHAVQKIHHHRFTMPRLSRRALLVGSASLAAGPAFGASSAPWVDVVIVGAGAAGIAAARRITAAGRRFALLEAADRIGGRCTTDTRTFGVPYDRGAHWLNMADINPVAKLAGAAKLDVYPA